jgi:hypothetical protein
MWRLSLLGGLRTVACANCGAKINVSRFSYLILLTLGTWIPVAGAIFGALGAIGAAGITGDNVLIGGAAGFVLSVALFFALYFRLA